MADLPGEAPFTSTLVREACLTLMRNRERYLAGRSTSSVVGLLCEVGKNWMDPRDPFRKQALEAGPRLTGFSAPTLARGLEAFFTQFTPDNFNALLEQDLGHVERLDRPAARESETRAGRAALAVAPEFLAHFTAGNVPSPALGAIALGLLTRSAQFVKCGSGADFLPRLFGHSLYRVDPKAASCLEIASWPGGRRDLEDALFESADCVTATGSDETLTAIRGRLPGRTRFVGYGHRVSFAYVSGDALAGMTCVRTAERAAADIAAWNQLGCLSPHVVYVEKSGGMDPDQFAELLARQLAALERTEPRGEVPVEIAAAIASRRSIYELRAGASADTRLWASPDSTAWTVVYEAEPRFQLSCLHRFVYVKPTASLEEALQQADGVRGRVSTVGLAAPEPRFSQLAEVLGRWGATRVCPLGRMQQPPLMWRHDGRPALGELVTWMDLERATNP